MTNVLVRDDVPLAPLTTLELGGRARHFVEVTDNAAVLEALRWAKARGVPAFILGGGSNVVVGDAGFDGLVVRIATRGRTFLAAGGEVLVGVAAGEPWDAFVADTVTRGLAGLECLSGIPGLAGATPIQNVGAYGQEVAETIRSVRIFDRREEVVVDLPSSACAFAYRDSVFRRAPERYVVLGVTFALRAGGAPTLRYRELADALAGGPSPMLARTREMVIALRHKKSMVLDAADPNRRSVGSFFTNPLVAAEVAERLAARAVAEGVAAAAADVPRWAAGPGRVKLSAGWLIERAGIAKGLRRGPVGVSSAHALALVHHGGGTTADLVALARDVRDAVAARFGVTLAPEPTFLGATL
ncbi:MAG: UDP-N-acetylenolpyruvoylglucosamine reductase [Myxococcales bacterium]|nr:UDP-N-acetylenolpyruvoylglucosamine reductase [Myxococcales bacterium]